MAGFRSFSRCLLAADAGVTALEFAFIASLISIAILAAVIALGVSTAEMWAGISNFDMIGTKWELRSKDVETAWR